MLTTYKLCAGGGFHYFILSEFEWDATAIEPQDQLNGEITEGTSPRPLGQVDL